MIHDLKPYPAYKDTGVRWLGAVPEHWAVKRLRNAAEMRVSNVDKNLTDDERPVQLCNYVDVYKNDRIRGRMPFMRATATLEEIERFHLKPGDVLITKDSEMWNDIGVPALVETSGDDLVCGYHLALLRPFKNQVLGGFLFRSFQSTGVSYQLHTEANGVTRYGLSQGAIKSVWLGLPPLPEQTAIVRFLDHADLRIRRYIRAKQKLVKLLEEQKQAVIHRAVTHGLDPNVCLKPSGVEWLGDVPEHWAVKRLKWVTRLQRGYDLPADSRVPGPYAVVSSGGIIDYHCEPRSRGPGVVMGRYGSTDAVFFIQEDFWPHNTALFVTDFQGNRPRWCYYLLRTISKADHAGKSAVPGVDRKDLYQIMVPVPPVSEQDVLVVEIETESADLDKAISSANHEISLLSEYRTRLIADLVTGKLDVREAAASLPDETGEQERILDDAGPFIEDDPEDDDLGLEAALEEVEA
jgi:type I restriction enzyme S subunit